MKKLIVLLSLITTFASAQQLAVKTFAKDTATDLKTRIKVWQTVIDAKAKTITYVYSVETLAPKGGGVITSETKTYVRYNQPAVKDPTDSTIIITPAKNGYNTFINGSVGSALVPMIESDINKINRKEELDLLNQ